LLSAYSSTPTRCGWLAGWLAVGWARSDQHDELVELIYPTTPLSPRPKGKPDGRQRFHANILSHTTLFKGFVLPASSKTKVRVLRALIHSGIPKECDISSARVLWAGGWNVEQQAVRLYLGVWAGDDTAGKMSSAKAMLCREVVSPGGLMSLYILMLSQSASVLKKVAFFHFPP